MAVKLGGHDSFFPPLLQVGALTYGFLLAAWGGRVEPSSARHSSFVSSMLHFLPKGREPSSGSKRFLQHLVGLVWTRLLEGPPLVRKELPRSPLSTWNIDENCTHT